MRLPATKFIVFNAAAGLVGVAALVAAARSVLMPATIVPCSERYHSVTAFALERAGVMLTAADLQAGFAGRDAAAPSPSSART